TEALHFGHRDALHADRRERFAHFVELEGLDDCRYEFHAGLLWAAKPAARLASECFADGKHGRGSPGVPRLGARRVKEAIGLQRVDADPRAGTLGVGAYDRRTEHPAGQILRDAHLVVGVIGFGKVFDFQATYMAVYAPTSAKVVRARKVDVVRMLGIGNLEVVAERVEAFQ